MALTDISRVTTAIATLVRQVLARDFADDLDVSAAPPEDETNATPNVISIYLFHIAEDQYRKNLPPRRQVISDSPVQFTEMGLVLNYVITARNTSATDVGARTLIEQRLLGFVARALHEFPVINDETVIAAQPGDPPNQPVLQVANMAGSDNRIELTLRPVGIEEAVNFWTAEQELTARLALFYEARVILLSTPPITSMAGIVYSLGGYVSVAGQPFIESALSTVGFVPPLGFVSPIPATPFHFLTANPARVSLFPVAALPATVSAGNNRFRINGADLRDELTFLLLRGQAGVGAGAPEERSFRVNADGAANPDWSFDVRDTEVTVGVRLTVVDDEGTGLSLYPGLYSLQVITARQLPNDTTGRRFEQSSNEVVIALTPQVVSVSAPAGPANARRYQLTLFGDYLRDELDIQLAVGGRVLRRDADPTIAGNYDFAAGTGVIDFAVDTTGRTSPLPVSLVINGAGATPAWATF